MAEITKRLGIAVADAAAGRITYSQLLSIFREAIDNGDALAEANEQYVVAYVFPLIDAGLLASSPHVTTFERRMNSLVREVLVGTKECRCGEDIVSQANAVGPILETYIAIHDDLFAGGFIQSLRRRVPIPGFFQAIDFKGHIRTLSGLAQDLRAIRDSIGADSPPPQLAHSLATYCQALIETVLHFESICRRLDGRRDDITSYSREAYTRDLAKYRELVWPSISLWANRLNVPSRLRFRRRPEPTTEAPFTADHSFSHIITPSGARAVAAEVLEWRRAVAADDLPQGVGEGARAGRVVGRVLPVQAR